MQGINWLNKIKCWVNCELKENEGCLILIHSLLVVIFKIYKNQINKEEKTISKFRKYVSVSPCSPKTDQGASMLIRTVAVCLHISRSVLEHTARTVPSKETCAHWPCWGGCFSRWVWPHISSFLTVPAYWKPGKWLNHMQSINPWPLTQTWPLIKSIWRLWALRFWEIQAGKTVRDWSCMMHRNCNRESEPSELRANQSYEKAKPLAKQICKVGKSAGCVMGVGRDRVR